MDSTPTRHSGSVLAAVGIPEPDVELCESGSGGSGLPGGQRAHLRGTQRHIAVSRPHALARMATRQFEVAREHVAWIEPFAFTRIGQPTTTALVELATVDIAIARVVNRSRIEVHRHLRCEELEWEHEVEWPCGAASCRVWPLLTAAFQQPPAFASLSCDSCGPKFGPSPMQKVANRGNARQIASTAEDSANSRSSCVL
jgi:hypothetical protein